MERCRATEGVLGTQFTCFTGTKVKILTLKTLLAEVQANAATVQLQLAELSERVAAAGTHSVHLLFTGTKVQILTQQSSQIGRMHSSRRSTIRFFFFSFTAQFTCCTRAKVQILTPEALRAQYNTAVQELAAADANARALSEELHTLRSLTKPLCC